MRESSTVALSLLLLCLAAAPAPAQLCQASWWQRDAIAEHRFVPLLYADAQQQTLLIDGDIWGWDGARWDRLPPDHPADFYLGSLAYDRARGRLLSVSDASSATLRTWEWDGDQWSLRSSDGPTRRSGYAMAFDPVRGRVVLVGGRGASGTTTINYGDMWEWDGSRWNLIQEHAIEPRSGHSMVFDEARGRMVLHGGRTASSGTSHTTETWEWDGLAWTLASPAATLDESRFVYDSRVGRVLAISGWPTPKMWAWSGSAWVPLDNPTFAARRDPGVAFDRARGRLVLSGGQLAPKPPANTGRQAADTWEWNGKIWVQVYDNSTPTRAHHAMAYEPAGQRLIAFGGVESRGLPPLADTLTFDGERWRTLPVPGPPARQSHAMVYDAARDRIVLHGGRDAQNNDLRDTWLWDGAAWTLAATNGPPSFGPVMTYDPINARCLLVPGNNELWSWDGAAWTLLGTDAPDTSEHCVAFDTTRARLVVDRGFQDVQEWDGTSWHAIRPPFNDRIVQATMAFDPRTGRCVRHGGWDLGEAFIILSGATWEWDGALWRVGRGTAATGRVGHAMTWDPDRRRMVLFGGESYPGAFADTWSTAIAGNDGPVILRQPLPVSIPGGQIASFAVETSSYWFYYALGGPETHRWHLDGMPLDDGQSPLGQISGSHARVLTIAQATSAATGQIHCVVSNQCASVDTTAVSLVVRCPADLTTTAIAGTPGYGAPDGRVSNDDFFFYLTQFAAGNKPTCDLTTTGATAPGHPGYRVPDGLLTTDDFIVYLAIFSDPC